MIINSREALKILKIIDSCKTIEQFNITQNWLNKLGLTTDKTFHCWSDKAEVVNKLYFKKGEINDKKKRNKSRKS